MFYLLITTYIDKEKIIDEIRHLDHKQLFELFNTVEDEELRDVIFKEFLVKVREASCSDVFGWNGYFNNLFSNFYRNIKNTVFYS